MMMSDSGGSPPAGPAEIRVLVVDDEMFVRSSLEAYLMDSDIDVTTARTAEEALRHIGKAKEEGRPFDAGIVDLRLPGMSGEALILEIHKVAPDMQCLIHTGSSFYGISDELLAIGMGQEHVLLKPLPDLALVVESIYKILGKTRG